MRRRESVSSRGSTRPGATVHFCVRAKERWGFLPTCREFAAMREAWGRGETIDLGSGLHMIEVRGRVRLAVIRDAHFITAYPDAFLDRVTV